MPKRLKQQRRGRGSPTYASPGHHGFGRVLYRSYDDLEKESSLKGVVLDIVDDRMRQAPLMIVEYEDGSKSLLPAPYGIIVGQEVNAGAKAKPGVGNVTKLGVIPEGTSIYNIEVVPGDGGKLVRTAGVSAKIISRDERGVIVQLPSKKFKVFNGDCRATIGVIAGAGRKEKPFYKAGRRKMAMHVTNRRWPRAKGTAMNPYEHPHGGGKRRNRKNYSVSRNASPGAKVGSISPRRTGRRKRE